MKSFILPFLGISCDKHGCRLCPPIVPRLHHQRVEKAQIVYHQEDESGLGRNKKEEC